MLKTGLRRLCQIQDASRLRKRIRNLGERNRIQLLASSIRGIKLQENLELLMVELLVVVLMVAQNVKMVMWMTAQEMVIAVLNPGLVMVAIVMMAPR